MDNEVKCKARCPKCGVLATGTPQFFKRERLCPECGQNVYFIFKICITGFPDHRKYALREAAKTAGFTVAAGMSKSLSALVIGGAPGWAKLEFATSHGIPVIPEAEFFRMLTERGATTPPRVDHTPYRRRIAFDGDTHGPTLIAIDFETANKSHNSACSVGLARIDGSCVSEVLYTLLRPPHEDFDYHNTRVHGLSWAGVKDSPTFAEWWPNFHEFISGASGFVAHNSSFDSSVLLACCEFYDISAPSLPFYCTCSASKTVLPELENHRLDTVCESLSITLNHHHAGDDALACARVWLKLEEMGFGAC